MRDRDVFACALLEQLYCLLTAVVVGTLLAQVLIVLVNVYFSEVLSVRIDVRTETMFLLLLATTGALLVFTAVVTGISSWRLSRESIAASLSQ
jgi:tetrahydromethanopterin S-methyltransferase subunit C